MSDSWRVFRDLHAHDDIFHQCVGRYDYTAAEKTYNIWRVALNAFFLDFRVIGLRVIGERRESNTIPNFTRSQ